MNKKPEILVFIDWYLPGFKAGGPIRSVVSIIQSLKKEANFTIVTSDRDFGDLFPYPNLKTDEWTISPDGIKIFYCSPAFTNGTGLEKLLTEKKYDVIYLNSLFSRKFTINPLRIIKEKNIEAKIVLAPRGMLGKGALKIKPIRKKLFLKYSRISGLYKNVIWHASSEQEEFEIKDVFGEECKVIVGLNLSVVKENGFVQIEKISGEARFVFISRISRKKNLRFALELFKEIPQTAKVSFDIYGPIEDPQYWNECLGAMNDIPENVSINIFDAIPPDEINSCLTNHHFFLFPTEHENFGHAILEALNASCPVLISDQTPWRNLEQEKCGWDIPLNQKSKWKEVMTRAIEMEQAEYDLWAANAQKKARAFQSNEDALIPFRKLFLVNQ